MMQQPTSISRFDELAGDYDRFRIGYSNDLYLVLESFGLSRGASALDVGCGTGLSSAPLAAKGLTVTGIDPSAEMLALAKTNIPTGTFVGGEAESLPFADASFDGAICAQAFHRMNAGAAFGEMIRVVKPGGVVAVWWKLLGSDDPMREHRSRAAARAGVGLAPDALRGGFGAFYAAPFATHTLRVLPFAARFTIDDWIGYEGSRATSRDAYGTSHDAYLAALRDELSKSAGATERMTVRYTQFLYLGVTAK